MPYLYLSKDETPEIEFRQKVRAVVCKTLAYSYGYDIDGDAVFDASDEIERRHIMAEAEAQGLKVFALAGNERPQILDARTDRDMPRCK